MKAPAGKGGRAEGNCDGLGGQPRSSSSAAPQASAAESPADEILAEVRKNAREGYRVTRWGTHMADVRVWYDDGTTGRLRPGKGVSIKVEALPEIVAALAGMVEGGAAMNLDLKPGVYYVVVHHDDHCQAQDTQSLCDCICNAEVEHTTEADFIAAVNQTRRQRREAERAAAKALRKARKT